MLIVHKQGEKYMEENATKKKAVSCIPVAPIPRLAQAIKVLIYRCYLVLCCDHQGLMPARWPQM